MVFENRGAHCGTVIDELRSWRIDVDLEVRHLKLVKAEFRQLADEPMPRTAVALPPPARRA
jgi:hypothetical protein